MKKRGDNEKTVSGEMKVEPMQDLRSENCRKDMKSTREEEEGTWVT